MPTLATIRAFAFRTLWAAEAEEVVEEVLHAIVALTLARLTLAWPFSLSRPLLALAFLSLSIVVRALAVALEVASAGVLRIGNGVDIHHSRSNILRNLGEGGGQIYWVGDLERLGVGAVNFRFFSIYSVGHDRPDQNTGRQSCENRESEA